MPSSEGSGQLLGTRRFLLLLSFREVTRFPILSPAEGKNPISGGLPTWLPYICWLLGVTSLASAFFTPLYSLELNQDQATSWVVSVILSVLENIFTSQPVKVIVLTPLRSLMMNRMLWLNKEKERRTTRVLALLGSSANCSSPPLPGLKDKNNPIYGAPPMNSPPKHPERTLKEKKLFRLTVDILGTERKWQHVHTAAHFPGGRRGWEDKMENIEG
ncbi:polycystic kidney disease protein 1-like 3 [Lemur catta]|uniref:polycystic kidney disease protein 1-like 3 n=1 Tax=Lemur catta TaxID=9447 RepID=UPI001E26D1FF|nr:polycystic kidney disease protein 1-like 3 [Lemur catta]